MSVIDVNEWVSLRRTSPFEILNSCNSVKCDTQCTDEVYRTGPKRIGPEPNARRARGKIPQETDSATKIPMTQRCSIVPGKLSFRTVEAARSAECG